MVKRTGLDLRHATLEGGYAEWIEQGEQTILPTAVSEPSETDKQWRLGDEVDLNDNRRAMVLQTNDTCIELWSAEEGYSGLDSTSPTYQNKRNDDTCGGLAPLLFAIQSAFANSSSVRHSQIHAGWTETLEASFPSWRTVVGYSKRAPYGNERDALRLLLAQAYMAEVEWNLATTQLSIVRSNNKALSTFARLQEPWAAFQARQYWSAIKTVQEHSLEMPQERW